MSAAAAIDVTWLETFQIEWSSLRACRHNLLLEGPATATNAVLRLLQLHIREPIVQHPTRAPLELPGGEIRTLILSDVGDLSANDQTRLLVWLRGTGLQTQVVSMTALPLFPRVTRGLFDEALYYCLNVMLLRVDAGIQGDCRTRFA